MCPLLKQSLHALVLLSASTLEWKRRLQLHSMRQLYALDSARNLFVAQRCVVTSLYIKSVYVYRRSIWTGTWA
jgi:hypothetical protein